MRQELKKIEASLRNLALPSINLVSEQLIMTFDLLNTAVNELGGLVSIGVVLAAALAFAPFGMIAAIVAGVVAAIASLIGVNGFKLGMGLIYYQIKQSVCELGMKEFENSMYEYNKKLNETVCSAFDEKVTSVSRAIAQAISLYENLLQEQEKVHQETLEQREAEKAWIAEKRKELEQVQKGIEVG